MSTQEGCEESQTSHPIMLAEAMYLLEAHKDRFKADFRSGASKIFRSTVSYLNNLCRVKDRSVIEDLRSTLASLGLDNIEIALFGSLFPQSVEEAKLLIPSLASRDNLQLSQAVEKIQQLF
jgi:DNA-directed RNA polymerase II subunit RPB4